MSPFNLNGYNVAQIVDALTSPGNRHETRVYHSCSDEELYQNPSWLLQNYLESGRAKKWCEEHREEYDV